MAYPFYTALDIISRIVIFGIIIVYGLAAFWNFQFLILFKWKEFSWVKLYSGISCIIMMTIYIYIYISNLFTDTDSFGTIAIRPTIFLLGGSIAANARARLTALLKNGGEKWTLRKSKM